jgi:hypothetical protein
VTGRHHADVQGGGDDLSSTCAVVRVRLNGLFRRLPQWGKCLMSVATHMCNVRSYFTYGHKPNSMTVCATGPYATLSKVMQLHRTPF